MLVLIAFCICITTGAVFVYKYINTHQHNKITSDPLYNVALTADVDSLAVNKKARDMMVYNKGKLLKKYKISLGAQPVGAKHFEGDNKTPEGNYYISVKNAGSKYHKSLGISYPNESDRRLAKKNNRLTGGDVMIHGIPNGYKGKVPDYVGIDWTAGCISVTDSQIDELFAHVKMRTPITILP
ncbi:L,D-transpeptidase family protein [Flavipsychrobacter stenotrophus]|nr:L,D-transpeptidase family protein [Flavipsychrobacter stenotrophus]